MNGFEIIIEANPHDIIMGSGRDDEKLFFFGSKMPIDLPRIFKRNEAIPFTMDDQGGKEYLLDPLETLMVNLFESRDLYGNSQMRDDPHDTGKTALKDESLHLFLIVIGQFQTGDTSKGPSHDPQILSQISSGDLLPDLSEDDMRILGEIGEGRGSSAGSITPVIGHDQVDPLLVIKRRDLVIIADHFTIPVEKKKPWPFVLARIKTTRDGNAVSNPNRMVKGISGARGKIFTGIKNKLSQKRLVEGRIIDHAFQFSTISGKREGRLSIFCGLDDSGWNY